MTGIECLLEPLGRDRMVVAGAIDKLALRLPSRARFSEEVERLIHFSRTRDLGPELQGNKFYRDVKYLNTNGLSSVLHLWNRRNNTHKLEICGIGKMKWNEIICQISQVADTPPEEAAIMRIDLAADILNYSVAWFRRNMKIKMKRISSEFIKVVADNGNVESLYFGKAPNLIRVYDKISELHQRYAKLKLRRGSDGVRSFEETYGYPGSGTFVTRVEVQFGGSRIPSEISTLKHIRANEATFNPFGQIEFLKFMTQESIDLLEGSDFLKARGVLSVIEEKGLHRGKRLLEKKTAGNATRLLARFKCNHEQIFPDLYGTYKQMLARQLTA